MTPDAAGIEAALADVLNRDWCPHPDQDPPCRKCQEVAAALLPVVTQAQAEALREAADAMEAAYIPNRRYSRAALYTDAVRWLRARADES